MRLAAGEKAPFAGNLLRDEALAKVLLEIEVARKVGKTRAEAAAAVGAAQAAQERATAAAREGELAARLKLTSEALGRAEADLAQAREAPLWRSPALWFAVGLALGVAGVTTAVLVAN